MRNQPPADDVLKTLGFAAIPQTGYRPDLSGHVNYLHSGTTLAAIEPTFREAGFMPSRATHRVLGGVYATSWERTTGPYAEERIDVEGPSSTVVVRATHSKPRIARD